MPAQSPAQRRRSLTGRAANVPNVGIWVTDAMLVQAMNQYQRGIIASCRRINSHAGPLESRRRATKRHMTGLMQSSHAFPPIWQFDVGPSSLQWEAPSSQEHRRRKREQLSVSGLFNSFVGWLDNQGSADKPFISPPDIIPQYGIASAEALAVTPGVKSTATAEPTMQDPITSSNLPGEIVILRSSIVDMDVANGDELFRFTRMCRQALRRRVERGELSIEALLAALEPLDWASKSRITSAVEANKVSAMIRRGVLSAMIDTHKQNPAAVSHELWQTFLDKLSASNADNHDIQLFWRLMDSIPPPVKEKISQEQICNLTRAFITAQANRHSLFAHWSARTFRFSQALQQLTAQQRRDLDNTMAVFLSQQDWLSENAKRMRFSWLVIKAYDTHTTINDFTKMYQACVSQDLRLNGMQRWQVLIARLSAINALDTESRKRVLEATYTSMSERWLALVTQVMASGRKETGLRELCAILSAIGEFTSTTRVLTSPPVHLLQRDTMEAIALACDNHELALQLHDAIDIKPRLNRRQPLWSWSVWTKYIEDIVKDPALDHTRIWQVLKLTHTPRSISGNKKLLAQDTVAKTQLLDQMGRWFIEAQHLNDRQVLRNLQRCVNQQRALTKGVSSQTLVNIVEVISRDLERGQRGRTSRIQWLLGLLAENLGPREAHSAASALKGWRWTIEKTRDAQL
ncbi:hypothetical protein QQS21_010807 [Conoideocrella luteorostrata]|uniref:Fungal specific transcription factor domain containing protein n=1 Tax=Conoideocrella luteorostrata TaxID=1105319 RepID=A0AAJ0FTV6_9HYPO|nr:hypothetical protein QQS21_010807 [Conoideocrella luteorostrata]